MIVGLIGAAGSGKSTVANRLVDVWGFKDLSFAGPLKDFCAEQFGWDRKRLDDDLAYKEEMTELRDPRRIRNLSPGNSQLFMTRRQVMQFLGTDVFRVMDPDHWIKAMRRELVGKPIGRGIVFADVRFYNEVGLIRELGGTIVRTVKIGGAGTAASAHVSETELATYHANHTMAADDGDVAALRKLADAFVTGVDVTEEIV